ncbi:MAG: hypothetical protein HC925_08395 [Coleofasciculaceae cyanobacterium SM2_3_26]|nr:hypothetical protein [Coleofasciculaceae cyanobacterium SM2_3_26]
MKKQALLRQRLDRLMEEVERFKEAIEAKDNLLVNLERELRRPMSNVNLALKMLEGENSPEKREHYLKILRDEFAREIALLNQASELQKLLSPENIRLLTQFQLLKQ